METGKNYTLFDIFSGNNKVVIPDLQREYCWPSEKSEIDGKDLVTKFVIGLMNVDDSNRKMGLIYAYMPIQDQIYLCDGQQRITTLYLLVGYLYRELRRCHYQNNTILESAHNLLISEYEEKCDDKEPRLQYAIRESTLLFLRDLVNHYFLGNDDDIVKADWYFNDYNNDPSIVNMRKALSLFVDLVSLEQMPKMLDIVMNGIQFLYFDMKSRSYGEEQYVVINTTGKPLTTSENYKPRFMEGLSEDVYIGEKSEMQHYADLWEDWESFFWKIRPTDDCAYVVDRAMKEFFKWIYIIEKYDGKNTFDILDNNQPFDIFELVENVPSSSDKKIKLFQIVDQYIEVLRRLYDMRTEIQSVYDKRTTLGFEYTKLVENYLQGGTDNNKMNAIHLIPLIAYLKLSGQVSMDTSFERMIRFLINRSEDPAVSRNPSRMVIEAVKFINEAPNLSPLDALSMNITSGFINGKELNKLSILKKDKEKNISTYFTNFTEIEESLWKADCLRLFRGDISQLFIMIGATIEDSAAISSSNIDRAVGLLKDSLNKCDDLFRRALLTYGDYSVDESWTYAIDAQKASFVNSVDDIRRLYLLTDNNIWSKYFVPFMIDLYKSGICAEEFENNLIENYQLIKEPDGRTVLHTNIFYYKLIHDPQWFEFMTTKTYAYRESGDDYDYWLLRNSRASSQNPSNNPVFDYALPEE